MNQWDNADFVQAYMSDTRNRRWSSSQVSAGQSVTEAARKRTVRTDESFVRTVALLGSFVALFVIVFMFGFLGN